MSKETFIIPTNQKHTPKFRSTNAQEGIENKESRRLCTEKFIEFVQKAADFYQKGWHVETGDWGRIQVNGHGVEAKFHDTYILVSNSQSRRGERLMANLTYEKPLTMKEHGAKVVAVIQNVIDRDEEQRRQASMANDNAVLAAHVMKYLAKKHGMIFDKTSAGGYYSVNGGVKTIKFSYQHPDPDMHAIFTFIFYTADGSTRAEIIDRYHDLGIEHDDYRLGGMLTKWTKTGEYIKFFEAEYAKLVTIVPEAIFEVKNGYK